MKRSSLHFFLLLMCFCLHSCSVSKQKSTENDIEEINMVLTQQEKAWNQGDIDAFMEGYWKSEQLSFIGSRGVTRGWQQTMLNYKKSYPDTKTMGKLEFEIFELRLLSNKAAYMIGKYKLTREKDTPSGHFNLLWEKIDGQWYIVSDHTSG